MLWSQITNKQAKLRKLKPSFKVPLVGGVDAEIDELGGGDDLIGAVQHLVQHMREKGLLKQLSSTPPAVGETWYHHTGPWHSGVIAFQGGMDFTQGSGVATYMTWTIYNGALFLLVGSPKHLLDQFAVNERVLIQGTSGSLMEIDKIFQQHLRTDEVNAVILPETDFFHQGRGVLWGGPAYAEEAGEAPRETSTHNKTLPHSLSWTESPALKLSALLLDYLANLPRQNMETVFRLFHRYKLPLDAELNKFLQGYENDPWRNGPAASRLRDKKFAVVYVGSPLFTAI